VVDDSKDFLASAVQLLSTYPEVEVVAAAFTAREAIDQVEVLQPDVVLIDLVMPEMDGLEATRELKASYGLKVIIWTLYGDARYHVAAAGAGADGFLSKSHIGKWLRPLLRYIYEL
jgi:DNA-binding NarL/FixJ family response regulator